MVFGWFRPKFAALQEKAEKAFSEKNFSEAIQYYSEALTRAKKENIEESLQKEVETRLSASKDALAKLRLDEAKDFWDKGFLDEAEERATIALERAEDPTLKEEAQTLLREIEEYEENDLEESFEDDENTEISDEEQFEAYLDRVPEELREGYLSLGKDFQALVLEARETEDPKEVLSQLDTLAEKHLPARFERALCHLALKDLQSALADLEVLLEELEPDRDLHRFTAEIYLACASEEGANTALRLTPRSQKEAKEEDKEELSEKAKDYLAQAADNVTNALELSPNEPDLYRMLMNILLTQGEIEVARRAAQAGLRRITTPDRQQPILTALGRVEAMDANWDVAEDVLGQAVSLSRGLDADKNLRIDREAAWLLTNILVDRERRLDDALELVRVLLIAEQETERAVLLLAEGEILLKQEKNEAAKEKLLLAKESAKEDTKESTRIKALLATLEETSSPDA